jgi:hypothetical protein
MGNPSPIVLDVFNSNGSDGALLENEDLTVTWNGTYVSTAKVDGMMSFNRYGDFNYHGSSTLGAFRAYLVLSSSVNSNSIEVEWLAADDATAINAIKQNINQSNDIMYNLNGQKISISSAPKGIYIRNGVKVIK